MQQHEAAQSGEAQEAERRVRKAGRPLSREQGRRERGSTGNGHRRGGGTRPGVWRRVREGAKSHLVELAECELQELAPDLKTRKLNGSKGSKRHKTVLN